MKYELQTCYILVYLFYYPLGTYHNLKVFEISLMKIYPTPSLLPN